jgi:hypothetical protein
MKKRFGKLFKIWRSDESSTASSSAISPTQLIDNDSATGNEPSSATEVCPGGGPSTMNEPSTSSRAITPLPAQLSPANTSSTLLGWNFVDDLVAFLTLASGVLAGQPFQTAAAAPLQLIKIFQVIHFENSEANE